MANRSNQNRNRRFNASSTQPGTQAANTPHLTARLLPAGNLTPEQFSNIKTDLRLILITTVVLAIVLVALSFILR
jgi:hypothetical protein